MPSKWAFLRQQFPDVPIDPKYHEAIAAQIPQLLTEDLATLAHRCLDLEAELDARKKEVSELKIQIEAIEQAIGQKMDDASLDSVVTAGYRWTPSYTPYPQVIDPPALREWATTHMPDNLALPWMTLTTVVKDALNPDAETMEVPPGVQVFVKRTFRRTKQ